MDKLTGDPPNDQLRQTIRRELQDGTHHQNNLASHNDNDSYM